MGVKRYEESVKSALWVQLVKCRGVKEKKEKTVSEWGEGGGGSDGWVGRATGGRYRERQEAGRRDRLTEKEAEQREERGRQSSSVSISFPPGSVAAYFLPLKFPSWSKSTVWRKILEWWTTKLNLSHSGLPPVGTTLSLGIEITKPYREGKHSERPRNWGMVFL